MDSRVYQTELLELLSGELGLTPYEARAYLAILMHGPLSPQGVTQHSGIPRPRTYDVLNSLLGKGLLMEQPGRPSLYASVPPQLGLRRMMEELEKQMHRQIQEKRKALESIGSRLAELQAKPNEEPAEEERVWVTRRDSAFIAKYTEAIRNIETEFAVATPDKTMPEKELVDAIRHVLNKGKTVRVIREVTAKLAKEGVDAYLDLISKGEQVRHLKYDGLRFGIFDRKDTVLVLPIEHGYNTAVWMKVPHLAEILHERFEMLWQQAEPARDILKRLYS